MQLGGEEPTSLLDMGGATYALKKLRRWKGEGPTERNRKMARFLINHGSLSSSWSHTLSEHSGLLIDLALEWGDPAMWEEVLEKSTREGHVLLLGLDELIRALNVFTFDRTKNMLVHSTLAPIPHLLCLSFLTESRSLSATRLIQVLRSTV